MKKRNFGIFLIGILGVTIAIFLIKKPTPKSESVNMRQLDIAASVTERGRVQSVSEFNVVAKSPGRVISVPVKEGQWVNAGDRLLVIDTTLAFQKRKEAQSQWAAKDIEFKQSVEALRSKQTLFEA